MSRNRKLFNYLSILIILAGLLGFSAQPANAATCTKFHTVQRGEYLVSIGRIYGVHWRTLAQINNLANPSLIFPGQRLCVSTDGSLPPAPPSRIPTFSIVSVEAGDNVTIRTANFPANDTFQVRMGKIGTQGIGGKVVDTINSGQGGTFTANFRIPSDLRNDNRVAIRLESKSGYYSYNWFDNETSEYASNPNAHYPTEVEYVMARQDVTIYSGPSKNYRIVGSIAKGQINRVTGISANGDWWRVICPNGTTGSCWVSAKSKFTRPTD